MVVCLARVVDDVVGAVGVLLSSVVLLVVVSSSSADDDDELEVVVSAGSLDVDVVAAAVVFLLSDESVKVVLGVAFADVVVGGAALVDVLLAGGSLSANSCAVSSASSILACGICRPAALHAVARGVMKEASKARISSGQP